MNIVKYIPPNFNETVAFCFIDNTHTYQSDWIRELIKNQADYTISNLYDRKFTVLQCMDEDVALRGAVSRGFKHAVVFSTGTEFINGDNFFNELQNLVNADYFVAGHILDRDDAYYELHAQCYVVNLSRYQQLGSPKLGKQELGVTHTQTEPNRSDDNYHDYYTPKSVNRGWGERTYKHKCHGWNLLSVALAHDEPIIVFNENIRNNKKHYYPESKPDFVKASDWIYYRQQVCAQEFVHTASTENAPIAPDVKIQQVLTPASGTWFTNFIDTDNPVRVIFYDYNLRSLDYWREHAPKLDNVTYEFIHWDLLSQELPVELDPTLPTLVNLSNIFCYEGTTFFAPLHHRVNKENMLIEKIRDTVPNAYVYFSTRAATGFTDLKLIAQASDMEVTDITTLRKPTWHTNLDWS